MFNKDVTTWYTRINYYNILKGPNSWGEFKRDNIWGSDYVILLTVDI